MIAESEEAKDRVNRINDAFLAKYGAAPEIYARSPGRVNLIGEHIDYEGYGVLPMAIALDTIVALRRHGGDSLQLSNLDEERYQDISFPIDPAQEVDIGKHTWGNYFLGAYKGVFEHLAEVGQHSVPTPIGLQVMVQGQVPTGGGLSSSAAIVCASALAILAAYDIRLTKGEVAEFTAKAEQYVGVTSGGMDQAISIMGRRGMAQHVEFRPVRVADVVLPKMACFVIANSLTVSNKAEGAEGRYNLRVVECRIASAVLARLTGRSKTESTGYKTLKEVEPLLEESSHLGSAAGSEPQPQSTAAVRAVRALLHEEPYSTSEIEGILGAALDSLFVNDHAAMRVLSKFDHFKLRQRAEHVYSEKQRVEDFANACNDSLKGDDDTLATLASLMNASQASCRDLYECSSPELDALVDCSLKAGAMGSRLTGAGWGGCTVSLIRKDQVDGFIKYVKDHYYRNLIEKGRVKEEDLNQTIFASVPAAGGGVLRVKV